MGRVGPRCRLRPRPPSTRAASARPIVQPDGTVHLTFSRSSRDSVATRRRGPRRRGRMDQRTTAQHSASTRATRDPREVPNVGAAAELRGTVRVVQPRPLYGERGGRNGPCSQAHVCGDGSVRGFIATATARSLPASWLPMSEHLERSLFF